ncbi:vacuolar protein sorting 55 family protein [Cavenderia fasciculata]|uniref:Vacuolar protein sorting 55 family protein n=1 Tax=Cavenderia fasciculata TaxID=261658 RepID=F4PLN8_CACFS|nr:vacuolar protein sorting 55 family protein [Cavenderia fasciculata]EGG23460.1 vacuolar protein sorting 55 family protein [Cavenderia fasciculata]|eukprot:XP_004361311.1 vacuolar protein sorting 55 family protein [Cavenderia fasciculata]
MGHDVKGMCTSSSSLSETSCVVSKTGWPIIVVVSYFLAPFPNMVCKNRDQFSSDSGSMTDLGLFITGFLIASGFGIPAVLAHSNIISYKALGFALGGGITVYATLISFMAYFNRHHDDDDGWGNY